MNPQYVPVLYTQALEFDFCALEQLVKEMPKISFQGQALRDYIEKIRTYGSLYFILDGKIPIALIGFYANNAETKTAYLSCIAVSKKMQGKGLGQLLFSKMCDLATVNGMTKLQLNVVKTNVTTIDFYKRNSAYVVGDGQTDAYWLMEKELTKYV